jgi:hypothetical protein
MNLNLCNGWGFCAKHKHNQGGRGGWGGLDVWNINNMIFTSFSWQNPSLMYLSSTWCKYNEDDVPTLTKCIILTWAIFTYSDVFVIVWVLHSLSTSSWDLLGLILIWHCAFILTPLHKILQILKHMCMTSTSAHFAKITWCLLGPYNWSLSTRHRC